LLKNIQAIRGMNDLLPSQSPYWQYLEAQLIDIATAYGYKEIRFPIVEPTSLFKRGIGEATDIVEKEMYTFDDRNGDSLTLRPEGTAGCVRACIQNGLLHNQLQRLWYLGPMFRYERPQKGRYRQFHQFGLEAFGMPGPDIDAEMLFMTARLWKRLGLEQHIRLEINSLGTAEERAAYREILVDYFKAHEDQLDEDSTRRLTTNPLRILDSKNPAMQSLIANAPTLSDALGEESTQHFNEIKLLLDNANISYKVNTRLVRGLDYYGGLVFEWVTDLLGAQNAVCSGGRYDKLTEMLGGKPVPAVGFALGLERVVALLESVFAPQEQLDVYFVLAGETCEQKGLVLAEKWRDEFPQLRMLVNCGGGSFKSQMKKADKSGAKMAFILGEEELSSATITVKFLREDRPQESVGMENIKQFV
jgi:histidyl-tRNA synthetase